MRSSHSRGASSFLASCSADACARSSSAARDATRPAACVSALDARSARPRQCPMPRPADPARRTELRMAQSTPRAPAWPPTRAPAARRRTLSPGGLPPVPAQVLPAHAAPGARALPPRALPRPPSLSPRSSRARCASPAQRPPRSHRAPACRPRRAAAALRDQGARAGCARRATWSAPPPPRSTPAAPSGVRARCPRAAGRRRPRAARPRGSHRRAPAAGAPRRAPGSPR